MSSKDILIIENLADFEKKINRDQRSYDINMMVMPGTLEDKHKDVDPEKGIQALRRQFNLVYILLGGVHDVYLVLITVGFNPTMLSSCRNIWSMLPGMCTAAKDIACISKPSSFSRFYQSRFQRNFHILIWRPNISSM